MKIYQIFLDRVLLYLFFIPIDKLIVKTFLNMNASHNLGERYTGVPTKVWPKLALSS